MIIKENLLVNFVTIFFYLHNTNNMLGTWQLIFLIVAIN